MQTVYVVTPVYNGAAFIDRCIQSVLTQSGDFRICYHVQDGGSNDGTVEKLKTWKQRIDDRSLQLFCAELEFSFSSEKDASMYDAIDKGFATFCDANPEDFLTWINYDDFLLPGACALAAVMGRQFEKTEVAWFTGMHNMAFPDGHPSPFWPGPLPQSFIANGFCDGMLSPNVQQEGTFFRKWLWDAVDKSEAFGEIRLAGDWNLWRLMATHAPLHQLENMATGRFSQVKGQMSQDQDSYFAEMDSIVDRDEKINRHLALLESDNIYTPVVAPAGHDGKFTIRLREETALSLLYFASMKVRERSEDYQRALAEKETAIGLAEPVPSENNAEQISNENSSE